MKIVLITHLIQCWKLSLYDHKTANIVVTINSTRNTNSAKSPPGGPGEVPGSRALCTLRIRSVVAREKESSLL